jgi:hypothetical protein
MIGFSGKCKNNGLKKWLSCSWPELLLERHAPMRLKKRRFAGLWFLAVN